MWSNLFLNRLQALLILRRKGVCVLPGEGGRKSRWKAKSGVHSTLLWDPLLAMMGVIMFKKKVSGLSHACMMPSSKEPRWNRELVFVQNPHPSMTAAYIHASPVFLWNTIPLVAAKSHILYLIHFRALAYSCMPSSCCELSLRSSRRSTTVGWQSKTTPRSLPSLQGRAAKPPSFTI